MLNIYLCLLDAEKGNASVILLSALCCCAGWYGTK